MLTIGDRAPTFTLPDDRGASVSLADFKGKTVVLYFYPKDDTPGCTKEACDFRDSYARFKAEGAVILGVSRDSVASHAKFKQKYRFPFPLLADETGAVCEAYDVWKKKSLYGRTFLGIERTTVVINGDGVIAQIIRKVKVDGHAAAMLDAVAGQAPAATRPKGV